MTSNAPTGDRLLRNLQSAEGKGVVRIEDRFDTDLDDLWSALTDPSRLSNWIGGVEGDLRPGGEFRFSFFATGSEGTGRVEACDPPRRLVVIMALGEPDEDLIEVTLATDGEQTILVWEERAMPLDQVAAYAAGVQIHVEDLAAYLAGRERREDVKARWDELQPAYKRLAASLSWRHQRQQSRLGQRPLIRSRSPVASKSCSSWRRASFWWSGGLTRRERAGRVVTAGQVSLQRPSTIAGEAASAQPARPRTTMRTRSGCGRGIATSAWDC